jgi:aspartyl-tRNA synthetase
MVLMIADERKVVNHVLGLLRLEIGRPPVHSGELEFLWITEFPLFGDVGENGQPIPAHHPFTMPLEEDLEKLDSAEGDEYLAIRSQAYDLVLNGWELGSGSVRIHSPEIQSQIFAILGIEKDEAQEKFGFLLDAFRYGAPPHAGFAFGIDRLTAILSGEENIREVIAFPKTQSGSDPLTNAPTLLDAGHLEELGLRLTPPST